MKSLLHITIALLLLTVAAGCGPGDAEDPLIGLGGDDAVAAIESTPTETDSIGESTLRVTQSNEAEGVDPAAGGDEPEDKEHEVEDQQPSSTSSPTAQKTDSKTSQRTDQQPTATSGTSVDRTEPAENSSNQGAAEPRTTSTTARRTTSSATSRSTTTTTARQTSTPGAAQGRFATLPPGASLPSGADCAARVRPAAETRSMNTGYNSTRGSKPNGYYGRVDGNFVGTTDEIIQWAACKWGIDEDWARAQVAKESWWDMRSAGDRTSDQNACHPDLRTGSGTCPESVGLMQVRYLYHREAFEDSNAIRSSAYNVDYGFAVWRSCYNGELTWLNDVERSGTYRAGDLEGCMGVWFTGRWYVNGAQTYIAAVRDLKNSRIWEQSDFLGYRG